MEFALRTFTVGLFRRPSERSHGCFARGVAGSVSLEGGAGRAGHPPPPCSGALGCADGVGCQTRTSLVAPDGSPCEDAWHCLERPVEIPGAPGFTTLVGGPHSCIGVTPEGDVHRWDVNDWDATTPARGFGVEWSLSVLKDSAGQRVQMRDMAISRYDCPGSRAPSKKSGEGPMDSAAVAAVALMEGGEVFTTERWCSSAVHAPAWRAVAGLQSHLVLSVSCGGNFCTALTARGELWSWGESACGALGLGPDALDMAEDDESTEQARHGRRCLLRAKQPLLIRGELANRRVAAVSCGDEHVIAATSDEANEPGAVYSWGCGSDCRLGYAVEGLLGDQMVPRHVPWITADLGEQLVLRRTGDVDGATVVRSTGAAGGEGGARTMQRRKSLRMPQRITQLACGSRHSVVVCRGGIICFGADDYRQLGSVHEAACNSVDGLELPEFASAPILALPLHDDKSDDGAGDSDVQSIEANTRRICCGPLHTAAVSSEGHLYVWGISLVCGQLPGVRRVAGFGSQRPVVAFACGAHFVVASAEVELAFAGEALTLPPTMPESLPLWSSGYSDFTNTGHSWRPANLPRKKEEEELRHRSLVRDLERSVQRRLDRERRDDERRRAKEARRELRMQQHTNIWLNELLPQYVPGCRPAWRTQRMWRQGLPPRIREALWPVAIGNVLRITPELFDIYKQQALDARRVEDAAAADKLVTLAEHTRGHGRERSTQCIPFDLPRTFPTLAFFSEGGPLHDDCARLLEAYTFYRPDIGYVQGMSFLAAMLLLYLPQYPAFVGLCNLLNSPSILGLYRLEPRAVDCRAKIFARLCSAQLPAVARAIDDAGLTPEMFLIEWFMTLYSKCLAIDVASVIWDLFLLDGEAVLYCAAIALLRICERDLLELEAGDLEGCNRVLGCELRARANDADELLWHISEVWRRSSAQLLDEIRGLEQAEFGPTPTGNGLGSSSSVAHTQGGLGEGIRQAVTATPLANLQAPRELLSTWRDSIFSRLMR